MLKLTAELTEETDEVRKILIDLLPPKFIKNIPYISCPEKYPEDVSEKETAVIHSIFLETLFHKVGENVYNNLSSEEMKGWERVMEADSKAISACIEDTKRISKDRRKSEDFCEAFQMLILNPALLWILSPLRYRYIFELLLSYLSFSKKEVLKDALYKQSSQYFANLKKFNLSVELIKDYYLTCLW